MLSMVALKYNFDTAIIAYKKRQNKRLKRLIKRENKHIKKRRLSFKI